MRATRFPILLLVLAAFVAAGLAVRSDDGGTTEAPEIDLRTFGPIVSDTDVIGSTWYCAAGSGTDLTVGVEPEAADEATTTTAAPEPADGEEPEDGEAGGGEAPVADPETEPSPAVRAESTVSIANLGDVERHAVVTIHPGRADPVVVEVDVAPASVERVVLSDHAEGPALAAMVEADGGGVAVARQLVGDHGIDSGSCASTSSGVWHFAWGDTSIDMVEVIALFNPFAGDAVVDVRFSTADGTREPRALTGLVVPARSVVLADVSAEVTRRDQVAATVTARSGRIIAERVQAADGSAREADTTASDETTALPPRTGLAVDLGSAAATEVSVHPFGHFAPEGLRQDVVVYNPSDEPAEVDVEVSLGGDAVGGVEPFELSLPPRSAQVVHLTDEQRLREVFGADVGRFGLTFRSVDGVPFVAEVVSTGPTGGLAASGDGGLSGTDLAFVEPRAGAPAVTILALTSLEPEAATTVTLVVVDDGERDAILEVELGPGERLELTDDVLARVPDDAGVLLVHASAPVAAELYSRWGETTGISARTGVPLEPGAVRVSDLVR